MLRSNLQRFFGRNGERGRIVIARVLLASLVLLFLGIGYVMSADAPKVQPAKLVKVTGDVSLLTPGAAAWRQANQRERILPGTKIRTGKNSSVLLELSPKNLVHVGEKAEFALNEALVRKDVDPSQPIFFMAARTNVYDYEVDQGQGRSTAILRGLGKSSQFEHRTPVAVAGVRGTVYACEVITQKGGGGGLPAGKGDNDGTTTNWAVFEGALFVQGAGGGPGFNVGEGQFFAFGDAGEGGGPQPMNQNQMQDLGNQVQQSESDAAFGQSSVQDNNSLDMNQLGSNPGGGSCYQ